MHKFFLLLLMICTIFALCGCREKHMCRRCSKSVSNIYYDFDGDAAYCKDCAKDYWAPHDYEQYRVKD